MFFPGLSWAVHLWLVFSCDGHELLDDGIIVLHPFCFLVEQLCFWMMRKTREYYSLGRGDLTQWTWSLSLVKWLTMFIASILFPSFEKKSTMSSFESEWWERKENVLYFCQMLNNMRGVVLPWGLVLDDGSRANAGSHNGGWHPFCEKSSSNKRPKMDFSLWNFLAKMGKMVEVPLQNYGNPPKSFNIALG